MEPKFAMYLAYLVITVGLTIWVARTLFRNGQIFLRDALADEELARSINHLLVVGFYLLNLGYVLLTMSTSSRITDYTQALERLATQVGLVMLILGLVHLFNLLVLNRFRRRSQQQNLGALVPPHRPPGRPAGAAPLPPQMPLPQQPLLQQPLPQQPQQQPPAQHGPLQPPR
jgi:hypothetical protein